MGCVQLNEIEEKIISACTKFYWNQKVSNLALTIIELSKGNDNKIKEFFEECQEKVKSGAKNCKIMYNGETFNFDGDEFSYIFLLYSDILSIPVKLAVNIDTFNQSIIFGNIAIPTNKEVKKLEKHLEYPQPAEPEVLPEQTQPIQQCPAPLGINLKIQEPLNNEGEI